MVDFGIYRMKAEDIDEILEIEGESFNSPWSRVAFESELSKPNRSYFLVVKSAGKVLGYIGFWLVFDEAHIVNIAVGKKFRGLGFGALLLASSLILADRLGAEKATLEVRVTNTQAQKLYEKFGFEIISIRKDFYTDINEDAYVMWIYNLQEKIDGIKILGQKARVRILNSEEMKV